MDGCPLEVTIDFQDFGHFIGLLDKSLQDKCYEAKG